MQLVAFEENGTIVFAHRAVKGRDYLCMECEGVVRLRGGLHRRDHFYHLSPTSRCRLNGKSMKHLQTQWFIRQALPLDEAVMERRFPEINRIADVCWEKERIVFEVQCSPISKRELLKRNRDYDSLGYRVVWIFHDQTFNKRRMTEAEAALQGSTFYFTNIDLNGEGRIYDQLSQSNKGLRIKRFFQFSVDLSSPQRKNVSFDTCIGRDKAMLFFSGDTADMLFEGRIRESDLEGFQTGGGQSDWKDGLAGCLNNFQNFVSLLYLHFFRWILEKTCR